MTINPCTACFDGNCVNCSGEGGFQIDRKPPYKDGWEVCTACAGLRYCLACQGTRTIEVPEVDTSELPLPFSDLPNQPNDLESWKEDIF